MYPQSTCPFTQESIALPAHSRPFSLGEFFSIRAKKKQTIARTLQQQKGSHYLVSTVAPRGVSGVFKPASQPALPCPQHPMVVFHQLSTCFAVAAADELLLLMSRLKDTCRNAARLDTFTDECSTASWTSCNKIIQRIKHLLKVVVCIKF